MTTTRLTKTVPFRRFSCISHPLKQTKFYHVGDSHRRHGHSCSDWWFSLQKLKALFLHLGLPSLTFQVFLKSNCQILFSPCRASPNPPNVIQTDRTELQCSILYLQMKRRVARGVLQASFQLDKPDQRKPVPVPISGCGGHNCYPFVTTTCSWPPGLRAQASDYMETDYFY